MAPRDLATRIRTRAARAGIAVEPGLAGSLEAYVELLARWNRRINLTALALEPPTDDAIDRLIVEPIAAARRVMADERDVIDFGSGGGSPAIPMKLALPGWRLRLVEAKVRKAAFLREAVRQLGLKDTVVEHHRVEELLTRPELHEAVDLVTVRALRLNRGLLSCAHAFLKAGGRLLWFHAASAQAEAAPLLVAGPPEVLLARTNSALTAFTKPR